LVFYFYPQILRKKECRLCGRKSRTISSVIGVCAECLRSNPGEALKIAMRAHRESRGKYGLPPEPPRDPRGIECRLCANRCRIPPGMRGFCGLVENRNGKLTMLAGSPRGAIVEWYYDPLPTNCVADWICPGCTGRGYPKWAYTNGPEHGYYNLAVFYGACNLDCLFCQNWQYRKMTANLNPIYSSEELAKAITPRTSCVCYFGGDPGPQLPHAIMASRAMLRRAEKYGMKIFRVCWETNGLIAPQMLDTVIELSLETGGNIKFDIKAWTPSIYKALTGVSNEQVFKNAKRIAKRIEERKDTPLFIASTLLVPGYVDVYEVEMIANFLASLNPEIPYRLLAFHPDYMLKDLPPTSKRHAEEAYKVAKKAGLENISIGNIWILSNYY